MWVMFSLLIQVSCKVRLHARFQAITTHAHAFTLKKKNVSCVTSFANTHIHILKRSHHAHWKMWFVKSALRGVHFPTRANLFGNCNKPCNVNKVLRMHVFPWKRVIHVFCFFHAFRWINLAAAACIIEVTHSKKHFLAYAYIVSARCALFVVLYGATFWVWENSLRKSLHAFASRSSCTRAQHACWAAKACCACVCIVKKRSTNCA